MRFALSTLVCAILTATFCSPLSFAKRVFALADGPSVKGKFELLPTAGSPPRSIEFNARTSIEGQTIGDAVFQDDVAASKEGEAKVEEKPLYLRAEFDCLVVKANKAVMSGSITDASRDYYVGRRFLLVVQDNGGTQDPLKRDKFTFGVYRTENRNWVTWDAERPDETGSISWLATDAERPDDLGTSSENNEVVGCKTFPLSSFSFLDATQTRGNVQVRP
jgi:hypothetical protein